MSKEQVHTELESQILEEIGHLDELDKDTQEYDTAVRNIVELHKPYLEQIKAQQAADIKNRELSLEEAKQELEKLKAERAAMERAKQQELEEARLEFEKQKADREALEAFRARKAREKNDAATLKQNHDEFMLKTIGDCALHVADMVFLGGFLGKSFEFEETGTYGSVTTKEVIKRLPFLGKKK